jgi:hypothetical protein
MRTPSPPYCRLDLAPPLADRFVLGWLPRLRPGISPQTLQIPPHGGHPVLRLSCDRRKCRFFPLAVSTVSSFVPAYGSPCLLPRPARHYPRFWIWHPSSECQRDFNPPDQCAAQRTICPLLTSATRSGCLTASSVPSSGRDADLPR